MSTSQAAGALDKSLTDSDLVPGKYEGGFKIWEGGIDLALYLTSGVLVPGGLSAPSRVLELGCGHGLPGIVALLKGAAVDFQDYNREVLQLLTIPTVLANWRNAHPDATAAEPPVRFFCGDWVTFGGLLERMQLSNAYDVVLTTETIYSLQGMRRLFSCIKQV